MVAATVAEATTAPGIAMGVTIVVWQFVSSRVRRRRSRAHVVDEFAFDRRQRAGSRAAR